jgi:hypothetical protein
MIPKFQGLGCKGLRFGGLGLVGLGGLGHEGLGGLEFEPLVSDPRLGLGGSGPKMFLGFDFPGLWLGLVNYWANKG